MAGPSRGHLDEDRIRARHLHYPDLTFPEYLESVFDWQLLDQHYADPAVAKSLKNADVGPLTFDYMTFLFERPDQIVADLQRYLTEGRGAWNHALPQVHFLRAEALNRELYEFLIAMGYEPEHVEFVLGLGRIYPDGRKRDPTRSWQEYYTPALKRLVREKERALFSIFPEYDD